MKNYLRPKSNANPEVLWFNHRKTSVHPEEVVYLKSNDNYTNFYLISGQSFLSSHTMKIYEQQLSDKGNFVRINRGVLLNLRYLMGFEQNDSGYCACLSTGEKICISRRMLKKMKEN